MGDDPVMDSKMQAVLNDVADIREALNTRIAALEKRVKIVEDNQRMSGVRAIVSEESVARHAGEGKPAGSPSQGSSRDLLSKIRRDLTQSEEPPVTLHEDLRGGRGNLVPREDRATRPVVVEKAMEQRAKAKEEQSAWPGRVIVIGFLLAFLGLITMGVAVYLVSIVLVLPGLIGIAIGIPVLIAGFYLRSQQKSIVTKKHSRVVSDTEEDMLSKEPNRESVIRRRMKEPREEGGENGGELQ